MRAKNKQNAYSLGAQAASLHAASASETRTGIRFHVAFILRQVFALTRSAGKAACAPSKYVNFLIFNFTHLKIDIILLALSLLFLRAKNKRQQKRSKDALCPHIFVCLKLVNSSVCGL